MNEKLNNLKKHIEQNADHIKGLAIAGGAITIMTGAFVIAAQRYGLQQHDDFLKEKDLYDEYWNSEDE